MAPKGSISKVVPEVAMHENVEMEDQINTIMERRKRKRRIDPQEQRHERGNRERKTINLKELTNVNKEGSGRGRGSGKIRGRPRKDSSLMVMRDSSQDLTHLENEFLQNNKDVKLVFAAYRDIETLMTKFRGKIEQIAKHDMHPASYNIEQ